MSDLADLPPILTVEEVAAFLRIGRSAAYEGIRSGAIPSVRIGRSIRCPRHALDRMLGIEIAPDNDNEAPGRAPRVATSTAAAGPAPDAINGS